MHFVERDQIVSDIARVYRLQARLIRSLIPRSTIRHIGSTAIPHSITKGDIDLLISVGSEHFGEAEHILSEQFKRNRTSGRSPTFSAFKSSFGGYPIGIQLVTRGSRDECEFRTVQAWLARSASVRKYNKLKRKFEGKSASAYRKAKARFIAPILRERP